MADGSTVCVCTCTVGIKKTFPIYLVTLSNTVHLVLLEFCAVAFPFVSVAFHCDRAISDAAGLLRGSAYSEWRLIHVSYSAN